MSIDEGAFSYHRDIMTICAVMNRPAKGSKEPKAVFD